MDLNNTIQHCKDVQKESFYFLGGIHNLFNYTLL